MKNTLSANEQNPEVDPSFEDQARAQRGGLPTAPPCSASTPPAQPHVPIDPMVERIAEIAAPGSAHKSDPITGR